MSEARTDERKAIRTRVRAWREGLGSDAVAASSSAAIDALAGLPEVAGVQRILAYIAKPGANEVDLGSLIDAWIAEGRTVSVPETSTGGIVPCRIHSRADLVPARFGLLEPAQGDREPVDPTALELVLVPAIAFDRRGHRLGFGGGYYDRFLTGTGALTIGVAHDGQLLDAPFPAQSHDVPVAVLVTASGVIRFPG